MIYKNDTDTKKMKKNKISLLVTLEYPYYIYLRYPERLGGKILQ